MSEMRPMESRTGREKQLYEDGSRVVAGGIVLNSDKSKVLMVSSQARPDCWVLPKGGAEKDESLEESAMREVWEESGAVVEDKLNLVGTFIDERPPKHWNEKENGPPPSRSKFYIYEMQLKELRDPWPESNERTRTWMSLEEARAALLFHNRGPLAEAVATYQKMNC